VQITVLGKSPAWQDANGACSGYLVEEAGTTLLLDCGNGVFGKLREQIDFVAVDAVVVSHLHADHFLDLIPFAYALLYAPRQQPVPVHHWSGTDAPACPRLYAPPQAGDVFRQVTGAFNTPDLIEDAFALEEYSSDSVLEIGPLRVRFHPVPHYIPTWAVEVVSTVTGGRLTFSADCSPNDALVAFARDTDLLLIEAALPRPERDGMRGHLTPAEAGAHGRAAGARQLVVTHYAEELGPEWVREEAERTYGDTVSVAHEGATFIL
jgi:ribonuclease BN (tRNA processing enzyme)